MLHAMGLSEEQVKVGLSAMKAMAAANGRFEALEQQLLEAAAGALGGPSDVAEATPDEVAAAFPDVAWRKRVLQAMVGMALIDGEASADEVALAERYAETLGLDEPWVKNLHRLASGQMMRLRFDFFRRMPIARNIVGELWREEGLAGLWKFYKTVTGKGIDNPELAWKYKRLGLLPEGTLGREWWKHMTSRKFAFPGEPGGLLEIQCHHDLTHVLTGYDTDPAGECQIAAFYSGYFKEEPFGFLFMVLVMFQVGAKLQPSQIVTNARLQLDPQKVIGAIERGSRINTDLTDHWDYWPLMDLPIDEVRRTYNIT